MSIDLSAPDSRAKGHRENAGTTIMSSTIQENSESFRGKTACPMCASIGVRRAARVSDLVYLRCEACGNVWPIPERRERAVKALAEEWTRAASRRVQAR